MFNKQLLFTLILVTVATTAIFGIALSASLEQNGQIVNCIFSGHQSCPPPDHINEWQQFFASGYNSQVNTLLFLFLILSLSFLGIGLIKIGKDWSVRFSIKLLEISFAPFLKYTTQANL